MKNVIINQYDKCVGCNTCVQICTKSCISMEINDEGFWYPAIDESLCIDCGLCRIRCPINYNNYIINSSNPDAFGAINLDDKVKMESSSGGIFTVLATMVLENDGVVFGAAFNDAMEVNHVKIDNLNYLSALRGSKYVQSNIKNTFKEANEELLNNKLVLYVGTPCQIAGLNSYLDKNHENLITCDLICKGVPSPGIFSAYLNKKQKTKKITIRDYKFRNKEQGWKMPSVSIEYENGTKETRLYKKDNFTVGFSKNIFLRSSCYSCEFSKIPRVADITLADFWGVSNYYPELDDDRGTSLVLINSPIGKKYFEKCIDKMVIKQVELEKALMSNKNAIGSVSKPVNRKNFFEDYKTKGYQYVEGKYMKPNSIWRRASKKIQIIIKKA